MKTLYIIRHAKSDWNEPGHSDFKRPLNKRGEKNAPLMGEVLARNHARPQLILSSPALRAKKTAMLIAAEVGYDLDQIRYEEKLYEATPETLLRLVRALPASLESVFLIGHNPGLTQFAEHITGEWIGNIPTCGVVTVTLDQEEWKSLTESSATMVAFDYPKNHTKK